MSERDEIRQAYTAALQITDRISRASKGWLEAVLDFQNVGDESPAEDFRKSISNLRLLFNGLRYRLLYAFAKLGPLSSDLDDDVRHVFDDSSTLYFAVDWLTEHALPTLIDWIEEVPENLGPNPINSLCIDQLRIRLALEESQLLRDFGPYEAPTLSPNETGFDLGPMGAYYEQLAADDRLEGLEKRDELWRYWFDKFGWKPKEIATTWNQMTKTERLRFGDPKPAPTRQTIDRQIKAARNLRNSRKCDGV